MRILAIMFVALGVVGCGKGGGGFESSEAVGKAFVEAINAQDKEAVKKLFPSDELLKETLECSEPKIMERITKGRDGLAGELDKDLKGMKMTWKGEKDAKPEEVKAGTDKDGCKFKTDFTMVRVKWQFTMEKDGKSEDEGEGVRVGKFGDKGWYLVSM